MEIIMFIIIALIAVLVLAYFKIGKFFYNLALNSKTDKELVLKDLNDNENQEEQRKWREGELKWLENISDDVYINSTNNGNLRLHAYEIKPKEASNIWVIVIHGYMGEGNGMTTFARGFDERKYNVLVVDLRGHGKSEGNYVGMGWDDRLDIIDWINYIIKKDKDSRIILFGSSMGAATVMMTTGEELPSNVKLAIEDCGYSSVWDEFSYKLKQLFKLPEFPVLYAANTVCQSKAKYDFKKASSIEQLKKSKTPTLFIHGSSDTFVPFEMLDKVYDACAAEKEKLVVDNAEHVMSMSVNPKLYWRTVDNFIQKYL